MTHARTALGLVVTLAGCGFPTPYGPEMLAHDALRVPEKALVHYLSQAPPLDLDVCDPTRAGPRVAVVDERLVRAVDTAFARRRIPAAHWSGCVVGLWREPDPVVRERIATDVLEAFPAVLDEGGDPNEAAPLLEAVLSALEGRPPDARLPEEVAVAALARVEGRLLPPDSTQIALAERFVSEVGLDLGRWEGGVVDEARVRAEEDEAVLVRFAARLPDPTLREFARERIVRLRIARGPWAEARAHEEEVVRSVLGTGRWTLDPAQWPVRAVRPEEGSAGPVSLVVVQDLSAGVADVRARAADGALVGYVPLAPLLALDVEGLSAPVSLCAAGDGLDPTPCVPTSGITLGLPLLTVRDGAVVLAERVPGTTVAALARLERLDVPVAIGEVTASLSWLVEFAPTPPLVLTASAAGASGPALVVRIRTEAAGRLVYEVDAGAAPHVVVVEAGHLDGFRVVSQGARGVAGEPGAPGRFGQRGSDGLDAVCPYTRGTNGTFGGDGGPGGPGGSGGPGGTGGKVEAFLKCSSEAECAALLDRVELTVASLGGAGGPGGKGGEGGQGGEGGRGGETASCAHVGGSNYLEGGLDGNHGLRADDGADGLPGPDGRPGAVTFRTIP